MRSLTLVAFLVLGAAWPGWAVQATTTLQDLQISATSVNVQTDGPVTRLRGNVEVRTDDNCYRRTTLR